MTGIFPRRFRLIFVTTFMWLAASATFGLPSAAVENTETLTDKGPQLVKSPVTFKLGAERFAIPRNYLDRIINPNRLEQDAISILIYLPDFSPARDYPPPQPPDGNLFAHLMRIVLVTQTSHPWTPADKQLENAARAGLPVRKLEPAPFDLLEIYNGVFPDPRLGTREFIGEVDGAKIRLHCQDPSVGPQPPELAYFCEFDFPYFDLTGKTHFRWSYLSDWKKIYRQTIALLNRFKEN